MTPKEIESIINNLPIKQSPGPDGSTWSLISELPRRSKSNTLQIFHKIEMDKTLSYSIYEGTFTMTPKPHKTQQRKGTLDQFPL